MIKERHERHNVKMNLCDVQACIMLETQRVKGAFVLKTEIFLR
jgi:hypothetical protein